MVRKEPSSFEEWLFSEEYVAGISPRHNKKEYYEIFKNPTSSELMNIRSKGIFARFIAIKNDIYVFPAELLHADAIKELELPISNDPPVNKAFLGVAKIVGSKLHLHTTNQTMTAASAARVEQDHPVLKKFFE